MKNIKTRVEQRLKVVHLNKAELAKKMGLSTQTVNNWFARDNIPVDKLFMAAEILQCDPQWLNTGKAKNEGLFVAEPASVYNNESLMNDILDAIAEHLKRTGDFWDQEYIWKQANEMLAVFTSTKMRPTLSNIIKMLEITHKEKRA